MIITDDISDKQRETAEFKSAYADMMHKLSAPGFVEAICAHEAAHLIYYEMIGPIRYELLPPRLVYCPVAQAFNGHFAAIKLTDIPQCAGATWKEWVTMMANAHAAGGVIGRMLFPASSGGDEGDKENFRELCTDLMNHFGGITIDGDLCWKLALVTVQKQLEDDPALVQGIKQRAAELRPSFELDT